MESSLSPEVRALLTFIRAINQDKIKDAQQTLTRFSAKNYQIDLKNLLSRYCVSQMTEKEIEKLIRNNIQLQSKIKKLKQKNIQEKKTAACKQRMAQELITKSTILDYLCSGNLQSALKEAERHKYPEVNAIVCDLRQYRWIKDSFPDPKKIQKYSKPADIIDFNKDTKHIKSMIADNKHLKVTFNQEMLKQLRRIYMYDYKSSNWPSKYFDKELKIELDNIIAYTKIMKERFNAQQTTLREIIIGACQKKDIRFNYDTELTTLLISFIQSFESRKPISMSKEKNKNKIAHTQPLRAQSSESVLKFIENIKTILLAYKPEFVLYNIEEISLIQIQQWFQTLNERLTNAKMGIQNHKKMLQEIASNIEQANNSLLKINLQLMARVPSAESITKINFNEKMQKFEHNLTQLLNLYDEKHHLLIFEERAAKETKQYVSESNQIFRVENIVESKRINDLKVQQQIEALKKQLQQAHDIIALEKNNSHKLRQKVKDSHIKSSIFVQPPFSGNEKEAELQEEIFALRTENQKLRGSLEEQRTLNINFQQRLAQALRKLQATKTAELQKQKVRYERLKQELNESMEQVQQLNKMFQDKDIFSSSRVSIQDKKQNIVNSGEKKNFISKIVQASVILSAVGDVDDPVLFQRIGELQAIVKELREMMQTKENEYRQNLISLEGSYNRDILKLKDEIAFLNQKIKDLQVKAIADTPQNLKNSHIFPPGFIFDYADHQERLYLIENLVSYIGTIKRTRLLFRYDHFNKTNFHRYIDGQRNVVVIIKTIYGRLIAAYSEEAFVQGATKRGFGLLLSLWARKCFQNKDQRAISYDDYYILFGNSQISIKYQQTKVFSNFGIANGYYDNKGQKVHAILGEDKQRQVDIAEYEIYALDLDD